MRPRNEFATIVAGEVQADRFTLLGPNGEVISQLGPADPDVIPPVDFALNMVHNDSPLKESQLAWNHPHENTSTVRIDTPRGQPAGSTGRTASLVLQSTEPTSETGDRAELRMKAASLSSTTRNDYFVDSLTLDEFVRAFIEVIGPNGPLAAAGVYVTIALDSPFRRLVDIRGDDIELNANGDIDLDAVGGAVRIRSREACIVETGTYTVQLTGASFGAGGSLFGGYRYIGSRNTGGGTAGGLLYINGFLVLGATGSLPAGTVTISLPPGFEMDSPVSATQHFGHCYFTPSGSARAGVLRYVNSTTLRLVGLGSAASGSNVNYLATNNFGSPWVANTSNLMSWYACLRVVRT